MPKSFIADLKSVFQMYKDDCKHTDQENLLDLWKAPDCDNKRGKLLQIVKKTLLLNKKAFKNHQGSC